MLNPFFLQGSPTEQNLVQDLINEQLKMYGVDVYYLPREYVSEKSIIKEVVSSKFSNAFPIEAYLDTYDGYGGQGTLLSKFGIEEVDDITLIISRDRYETYIQPLVDNLDGIKLGSRPKEGDLIYFPLGDRIFEIKYVEHEKPFYQLNKNYVYELRCELFRYQDEIIDTSIEMIDDNTEDIGYIHTLQMFVGGGVTATAYVSTPRDDGIISINLVDGGKGYTSPPTIKIALPRVVGGLGGNAFGSQAIGVVSMRGPSNFQSVDSINIINSGFGYTTSSPPKIIFLDENTGSGVDATATVGFGGLESVRLIQGGSGYINPPTVTISPPDDYVGVQTAVAKAIAVINEVGVVTAVYLTNAGLGYTTVPSVTISDPDLLIPGSGTFKYNETVTGSLSGSTGIVKSWNIVTGVLELSNVLGKFYNNEQVVGSASSATFTIKTAYEDNLEDANDSSNKYGKYEDNYNIQVQADKIVDFTEKNPFGRV